MAPDDLGAFRLGGAGACADTFFRAHKASATAAPTVGILIASRNAVSRAATTKTSFAPLPLTKGSQASV